MNNSSFKLKSFTNAPLELFRFCLWWESFFNGGHFSTCQTRKKSTPVTFFLHTRHVFLRPGVISLRRKMTPRSIFDGGRYSSLHRRKNNLAPILSEKKFPTQTKIPAPPPPPQNIKWTVPNRVWGLKHYGYRWMVMLDLHLHTICESITVSSSYKI